MTYYDYIYLSNFANCFLDFLVSINILPIMNSQLIILVISILVFFTIVYSIFYIYLDRNIVKSEKDIINIFLKKIAKIPAVIEVMRPYVIDQNSAFDLMVSLHSEGIIHDYTAINMLLEHNARINDQYSFLMKLSMAIPELQKDPYFLYIRDFVISYDRIMNAGLPKFNQLIKKWNIFVKIKNYSLIWYFYPGQKKIEI